jgi:DNA/RNA endonuclease YhcR with UshA esterase domain
MSGVGSKYHANKLAKTIAATIAAALTVADGSTSVSSVFTVQIQGQRIEVTGFSGQFADHFEVDPRQQDDIKIVP